MTTLKAAQEAFWRAAFVPATDADPAAYQAFAAGPRLQPAQSLAVYGRMSQARHLESLRHDFPLLARGLGEADFASLADAYLLATQARRQPLGRLGAELWAFLEREGRPRAEVELAALEDMRTAVHLACDVAPVSAAALAAAGDGLEDAHLTFVPACRHRRVTCDLARLVADPQLLHDAAALAVAPHRVVVWRRGFDILQGHIEGARADALQLAVAGATVRGVCGIFGDTPDAAQEVAACLGAWFADGWVARVA